MTNTVALALGSVGFVATSATTWRLFGASGRALCAVTLRDDGRASIFDFVTGRVTEGLNPLFACRLMGAQ